MLSLIGSLVLNTAAICTVLWLSWALNLRPRFSKAADYPVLDRLPKRERTAILNGAFHRCSLQQRLKLPTAIFGFSFSIAVTGAIAIDRRQDDLALWTFGVAAVLFWAAGHLAKRVERKVLKPVIELAMTPSDTT